MPSQWSWNSACDWADVIVYPDVFGDGRKLDVVDRYIFRDSEMEAICQHLHQKLTLSRMPERFYLESQLMRLAVLLLRHHSTASQGL